MSFRVVFRPEIKGDVHQFSKVHQYDGRQDFKEEWTEWCEEHQEELESEYAYQRERGFKMTLADMIQKLYVSSRYYHRKKPNVAPPQKARTKYVRIEDDLLNAMRDHITYHLEYGMEKPSIVYTDFCEENESHIKLEIKRLGAEYDMTKNQVKMKLKKTYKNLYYTISKKA